MKIALIMHELKIEGGGERQCLELASALLRKGNEVTVYSTAYDAARCFPEIAGRLNIRQVGRGWLPALQKPRFLRAYLDMVHLAGAVSEQHDLWNPHHWPAQWAAVWIKRKLGGKVLWMCNDVPTFPEKSRQRGSLKATISALVHHFYYWYDRRQNRQVDLTALLSRWAEKEFKAVYPGPTRLIKSGMDPERFAPGGDRDKVRRRFGYQDSDFVLLWLGIFMPHRRLQDAIDAIATLTARAVPVKLLLAGDGGQFPEYLHALKAQASRLRINEAVIFSGKVDDHEIRDFYCACDAFLFPNDHQTWGLAVLEAMSCGRPVLVSRGSGVHEVLTDGSDALLFPPRDPDVMAAKIEMLVRDSRLREKISQNGMRLVREEFNWDRYAAQVESIAREITQSPETKNSYAAQPEAV